MKRQQRPLSGLLIATIGVLTLALPAQAAKLELGFGGYSFTATNGRTNVSSSISGAGSYRVAYRHAIRAQYELDLGYSLIATDTVGGDLSFGVDIGVNYFFLSNTGDIRAEASGVTAIFHSVWRPFVGLSFNQRNFQSTSAQYAGMGLKGGVEYQFTEKLSGIGTLRYISLGGPNKSEASQIDILLGVVVQF